MPTKKGFRIEDVLTQHGYLLNYCDNILNEKNYYEEPVFKGMPQRMAYETEIWMIGELLRQNIMRLKKDGISPSLLIEILEVINMVKYGKGRESFVMLLHYFKDNPIIESSLASLLNDKQLYGFAIKELNKISSHNFVDKVEEILKNEKTTWIKKEAEKYIKKSLAVKTK